jgi:hypothetical protein
MRMLYCSAVDSDFAIATVATLLVSDDAFRCNS